MPEVKFDIAEPYGSKQLSPFNSQNTFKQRDIAILYDVSKRWEDG